MKPRKPRHLIFRLVSLATMAVPSLKLQRISCRGPHRGKGYVPEALAAILTFARVRLGQRGVRGQCHAENAQSARVFEKAGFTDLGIHPDPERENRLIRRFSLAF
jgi:RimJ/RimL family protein N-acetyltransferase